VALALLVLPVTAPAAAGPAPRVQTPEQDRVAAAERQALADLAESSAQVRSAAVALSQVAAQLPGAQRAVAEARGGLAGARAKVAAASAELERAEAAQAAAAVQVEAADAQVAQGRQDVGLMARRTYQRGRLGGLREVMDAGEPQDVLERATMLRRVFQHQDATLDRLTTARLALASRQAGLAAERRAVVRARARAREREDRARAITEQAEVAADRVAALLATRSSALRSAEGARAADQADYASAQAASRALAERIREAARRAAAEEARRRAQAEAAARAAAARAAQAAARSAAASAAQRSAAQAAAADAARRASRRSRPAPQAPAADLPSSAGRAGWLWPCGGCPQTSSFGWRTHPIFGDRRLHAGIDMGAPIGTTVRAAESGTVLLAGSAGGYGTLVVVGHGGGLSTAYAHMSSISVSAGQSVGRGEKVGEVGNEGNSTGPHLHFEVRSDGEPVDPSAYVGGS
jgi:murein DD-endopeptidase MepM/ murein hydrolase activator NlpD